VEFALVPPRYTFQPTTEGVDTLFDHAPEDASELKFCV
jgi:hypothetical protein